MAKVVDADLQLEAVLRLGLGAHHHCRVVYQHVDPLLALVDLSGAVLD